MPISFRMLTLSGFLFATALGFSSAQAAVITNGPGSSVCLDVKFANTANFTPVQSFPCNVTFAQVWNFEGLAVPGIGSSAKSSTPPSRWRGR